MKKVFFVLGMFIWGISMNVCARPSQFELIKKAAFSENVVQLQKYISMGYSLDIPDANGINSLCYAILNKNYRVYELLTTLGADSSPTCINQIAPYQYQSFMKSMPPSGTYYYISADHRLSDYYIPTQNPQVSHIRSNAAFWGTLAVLGGGAIALAAGGGGGGGGGGGSPAVSDPTTQVPYCQGGNMVNGVCICPDGYILDRGVCLKPVLYDPGINQLVVNSNTVDNADKPAVWAWGGDQKIANAETITLTNGADVDKSLPLIGLLAEKTADATNEVLGVIQGSADQSMVGIYVNGNGSNALNQGQISLSHQSNAFNIYGIRADATAGVVNDSGGQINILTGVNNPTPTETMTGYAIYSEGPGQNVFNRGEINLTARYNTNYLYGIYAPNQTVRNIGVVNTSVVNPIFNGTLSGLIAGAIGKNVYNQGDINLSIPTSDTHLSYAAMMVLENGVALNQEGGKITMDITGMRADSRAMFGAVQENDLINQGNIKISGTLNGRVKAMEALMANALPTPEPPETELPLATTPIPTVEIEDDYIENYGTIDASELSLAGNSSFQAMTGYSGIMNNFGVVNIKVADSISSLVNPYSLYLSGMQLDVGELTLQEGGYLTIDLGKGFGVGTLYGLNGRNKAEVTNNGRLVINSKYNGLSTENPFVISGINGGNDSKIVNNSSFVINTGTLEGTMAGGQRTGLNTNLFGMSGFLAEAENNANITLNHYGTGGLMGIVGLNNGIVTLNSFMQNSADNLIVGMGGLSQLSGVDLINSRQVKINYQTTYGSDASVPYGTIIGMQGTANVENNGDIIIQQTSSPYVASGYTITGMKGRHLLNNTTVTNTKLIQIEKMKDNSSVDIIGIDAVDTSVLNSGDIQITSRGGGSIYGIKSEITSDENILSTDIQAVNSGKIYIAASETTHDTSNLFDVVGIYTNANALNSKTGTIQIVVDGSANAVGMLAVDGGYIENQGTIQIESNSASVATGELVGMYAVGSKQEIVRDEQGRPVSEVTRYSTVVNTGLIQIRNSNCTGASCLYPGSSFITGGTDGYFSEKPEIQYEEYEYVYSSATPPTSEKVLVHSPDGTPLPLAGGYVLSSIESTPTAQYCMVSTPSVVINQNVDYYSEKGGVFDAEGYALSGSVIAGVSNITGSNQDTYLNIGRGNGAVIGNGVSSDIALSSASVMFDTSWQQNQNNSAGLDIVSNRIKFDQLLSDLSVARFLEANYQNNRQVSVFDTMKGFSTITALNNYANSLTGQDFIPNIIRQDFNYRHHLNKVLLDTLARQDGEKRYWGGYDYWNSKTKTRLGLSGYHENVHSMYLMADKDLGQLRSGIGLSLTRSNSDYRADSDSHYNMVMLYTPLSWRKNNWVLSHLAQLGYRYGSYNRYSNGHIFKADVDAYLYGASNRVKYVMDFDAVTVYPMLELNWLSTLQDEIREEKQTNSLNISGKNYNSVQGGVGLYIQKQIGDLFTQFGGSWYYEMANPYRRVKASLHGWSDSVDIAGYPVDRNSGLLELYSDYKYRHLSIYGRASYLIEQENRFDFNVGIQFEF